MIRRYGHRSCGDLASPSRSQDRHHTLAETSTILLSPDAAAINHCRSSFQFDYKSLRRVVFTQISEEGGYRIVLPCIICLELQVGLEPRFCLPLPRHELPGQVVVIENPMDSKCAIAKLLHNARNPTRALDPEFFRTVIGGGNQHFDSYLGANRRTRVAYDQSSIKRHITRKASAHAFAAIIPVEYYGQLQLVADCHSTLYPAFEDWAEAHK